MESPEFHIQHMGLKNREGIPNSFESILKNYRGAQEMDTLLLRDGEIAVVNDKKMNMTPEQVESMTLVELENHLNQIGALGEGEKGIPSFKEFLGLASDADTKLRVELRASSPEQAVKLARAVITDVTDMDAQAGFKKNSDYPKTRLRFVTFSIPALQEVQAVAKEKHLLASTGLFWPSSETWSHSVTLYDQALVDQVPDLADREWNERGILVAKHFGFSEIELQPDVITPKHVQLAHELGLEIGASLTRFPDQEEALAKKLMDMGVDHMLTEK